MELFRNLIIHLHLECLCLCWSRSTKFSTFGLGVSSSWIYPSFLFSLLNTYLITFYQCFLILSLSSILLYLSFLEYTSQWSWFSKRKWKQNSVNRYKNQTISSPTTNYIVCVCVGGHNSPPLINCPVTNSEWGSSYKKYQNCFPPIIHWELLFFKYLIIVATIFIISSLGRWWCVVTPCPLFWSPDHSNNMG